MLAQWRHDRSEGEGIQRELGYRAWSRVRPRFRITWDVEGEGAGKRASGSIPIGERSPQTPLLSQGRDQGGVAVLLVEHRAFGHPRRHDDSGDSIAGAVER